MKSITIMFELIQDPGHPKPSGNSMEVLRKHNAKIN